MEIACLDMEGVLTPEVWINVAERTGVPELKRTTRDEPDYNKLMQYRLKLLDEHKLTIKDIQTAIDAMGIMPGARDFMDWMRERFQVFVLSDTFYEFAAPLIRQLGYPTLFCHRLEIDENGRITNYVLRQEDQKRQSVIAFKNLNYRVIAAGDSYNDTSMLGEAHAGILFKPPQNVIDEFPQYPVTNTYEELRAAFLDASEEL